MFKRLLQNCFSFCPLFYLSNNLSVSIGFKTNNNNNKHYYLLQQLIINNVSAFFKGDLISFLLFLLNFLSGFITFCLYESFADWIFVK